jgi:cyclopropane fatty-acyl-phospholipid synthase-like methyltransferase
LFDRYAPELVPGADGRVLEVGCGTGATLRALVRRPDFAGVPSVSIKAPNLSPPRASSLASETFADQVEFDVGDAHRSGLSRRQLRYRVSPIR